MLIEMQKLLQKNKKNLLVEAEYYLKENHYMQGFLSVQNSKLN